MEGKGKAQWMEDVMSSLDGLEQARPPHDLFSRLERKLAAEGASAPARGRLVSLRRVSAAAACILLLVLLNLAVLTRVHKLPAAHDGDARELVNDYHLNDSVTPYE